MKFLVVFVGLALAVAAQLEVDINSYHEKIGIPLYERLSRAEEAQDFDGSRIVGGSVSSLGAHPHLGGLLVDLTNGQRSMCGSSLISNTRVVTAAHCWRTGNLQGRQVTVVLGSTNINSGGTRILSTNVRMHPNYNMNNANNDVAVIIISSVSYTTNIRNIGLATGSDSFSGVTATAAGYGLTADPPGGANSIKRHVNLQVIPNSSCSGTWAPGVVISSTLCASGAGGRSTCFGDSGGPLAIGSGTVRTLIGITSFGTQWCTRGFPVGFARVTSFTSWIQSQ